MQIEKFIENLRNTDLYIKEIYTKGGCFQFYVFLSKMFEGCTPFINSKKNHIITRYKSKFYDINELIEDGSDFKKLKDEEIPLVARWSCWKNNILYLEECEECGSPFELRDGLKNEAVQLETLKQKYVLLSELESELPYNSNSKVSRFIDKKMRIILTEIETIKKK